MEEEIANFSGQILNVHIKVWQPSLCRSIFERLHSKVSTFGRPNIELLTVFGWPNLKLLNISNLVRFGRLNLALAISRKSNLELS